MGHENQVFKGVSLAGAKFHEVGMSRIEIVDACLKDASIRDANYDGMTIDGIAVNDLFKGHFFRLQATTYQDPSVLARHRESIERFKSAPPDLPEADRLVDYIDRAGEFFCEYVSDAGFRFHCVVAGGAVNAEMSLGDGGDVTAFSFE